MKTVVVSLEKDVAVDGFGLPNRMSLNFPSSWRESQ